MRKWILTLLSAAILAAGVSYTLEAQNGTNTRIPEGTCGAGAANIDLLCANSADHTLSVNPNNAGLVNFPKTIYLTGSAYTNATTTFTQVGSLTFPVSASRNYQAVCRITWQGTANTTGPKYEWGGPTGATAVTVGLSSPITASTIANSSAVAFTQAVGNSGSITTTTNFTDTLSLGVINGATAGTVILYAAANGAGTLTIQPGSYCTVQ